jgi:heptosyltransferase-2
METCRHFKGDRPCKYYWIDKSWDCSICVHHNPFKERILVIKLDALGDVVRSTVLTEGLKKKYPESQLTWLTRNNAKFFLTGNKSIDRIMVYNDETVRRLQFEKFDTIINLDKDTKAASMMMLFNSNDRRGYGLHNEGHVIPLNDGSKYHYNMCLDNWGMKTKNKKSYQEIIFEIAELDYDNEKPIIYLEFPVYNSFKERFLRKNNINDNNNVILLNTGCGPVYPHKKWTFNGYKKLIEHLLENNNNKILLVGLGAELLRNKKLWKEFKSESLIDTTNQYTIEELCYLINLSDVVVTGDTVALHIAISLDKNIVSFFGPTPHQEVNLFGLGEKLVRDELDCLNCYDQFPCPYDGKCMSLISSDVVYDKIRELL